MAEHDDDNVWTEPTTILKPIQPMRHEFSSSRCILRLVSGPGSPAEISLSEAELIIGRASDAGVRIGSAELSRHHLRIKRKGDEHMAEDMESRNGVYLNGVRIHTATLRDGDTLQIGSAVLTYHEGR